MALFGAAAPIQVTVVDANEAATADVRPAIIILLIAVGAAVRHRRSANVANLQVARSTARHRELTIRAALGAGTGPAGAATADRERDSRRRSARALGLLLSLALHRALPSLLPAGFPRVDAIAIDGRVLLFTLRLSVITSLACGVLPLLQLRRLDLVRALAEGALASAGAGRRPHGVDPRADCRQPGRGDLRARDRRRAAGAQLPGAT